MRRVVCGMLLVCGACISHAKSFGVVGVTFPIQEMSFLTFIGQRLQALEANGALSTMQSEWQARAESSSNRPMPVGLPRATLKRSFHYDPTVILSASILNEKGGLLYPSGTRVNGLERMPNYVPCWLFLNADDKAQLRWARLAMQQCQHPKVILTGGAVRDAEVALDVVIYFDQGGALSKRFQLNAVPATVTRDVNRLKISELVIKENGDAI
jgi:conjugal transfer pilus assembly protein TraW